MSTPARDGGTIPAPTTHDDDLPYQERLEYVIRKTAPLRGDSVISNPPIISATYVQAELVALRTTVLELTAALRAAKIVA